MHGNARLTPLGRLTMVMRIESGRPVAHVAAEMGVSRPTAYKWWNRWLEKVWRDSLTAQAGRVRARTRPRLRSRNRSPSYAEH